VRIVARRPVTVQDYVTGGSSGIAVGSYFQARQTCHVSVATDALIDPIVYWLYGLTDEDIALVEGR
jgi:hypothetical protein